MVKDECAHKAISEKFDHSIGCVSCAVVFVTPEARTKDWIEELIDVRKRLGNDEIGETFEQDFLTKPFENATASLKDLYGSKKKAKKAKAPVKTPAAVAVKKLEAIVSETLEPGAPCRECGFALSKTPARCNLCGWNVCDAECLGQHERRCPEVAKANGVYGPLEFPPAEETDPYERSGLFPEKETKKALEDQKYIPASVEIDGRLWFEGEIEGDDLIVISNPSCWQCNLDHDPAEHDAEMQEAVAAHAAEIAASVPYNVGELIPRDPDCKLCPLHARATNVCVPMTGPARASILFVGGSPTVLEDAHGLTGIGDEGTRFNGLLERAELVRGDVRLTLSVKCLTPSGREPNGKELRACSTHLMNDIRATQPSVIVLLGSTALKAVTGLTGISKERGKRLTMSDDFRTNLGLDAGPGAAYDPFIIATYAPGATVHDPTGSKTATIIGDLKIAGSQAAGTFAAIEVPWVWETGPAHRVTTAIVSADIETNGLKLRDPGFRIRMISVDTGLDPVLVYRGTDVLHGIEFIKNLYNEGVTIVGHNWSAFDRVGIQKRVGPNIRGDDTMLIAHLLDETQRKGLEPLSIKHLNVAPWKGLDLAFWQRGPQTEVEWQEAGQYSAQDSRYTRLLYLKESAELEADPALKNYHEQFFLPVSRALSAIEQKGAYASLEKIGEAIGEFSLQRIRGEAKVRLASGDPEINPGSSKQMRELLFDKLNLPVQEWTDGDEPSSNESSLKRLRELVNNDIRYPQGVKDIVKGTLEYREAVKMLGTYLEPYAQDMMRDGRLFFWYSVTQSVTRSSSDGQQIPRDKRIRRIITPTPGKWIVHADASQLELRVAAHLSGDENMRGAYIRGDDLHVLSAMKIYKLPAEAIDPPKRTTGKTANFLLLYGAEEYTYEKLVLKEYDKVVERAESTVIRDGFFEAWPRLPEWYQSVWDQCSKTGVIRSLTGRKRAVPAITSPVENERVAAFREAINFTDQDVAFAIAGLGLIVLTGLGYEVSQFVHDSYDLEIDQTEEAVQKAIKDVKSLETAVPALLEQKFGIKLTIPLVFDHEIWR
jgi:uracil-DNA glycosylase family 4